MAVASDLLDRVQAATCAIGLGKRTLERWRGQDVPAIEVVGTGFLVADGLVLTNRHVTAGLQAALSDPRLADHEFCMLFHDSIERARMQFRYFSIGTYGSLDAPAEDVAFINVTRDADFASSHPPLLASESFDALVADDVLCVGFPFGTDGLRTKAADGSMTTYRFGPIAQQGHISALAPYASAEFVDRLLLDIRTEGGMSGAAVVDAKTGRLIGLHTAGRGATTAYAIPLTAGRIRVFQEFAEAMRDRPASDHRKISRQVPKARRAAGIGAAGV